MNEKQIQRRLSYALRQANEVVVPNVFILGSAFESDMVRITPAGFYVEYEIKVSYTDFRCDLHKKHKWGIKLDPASQPHEYTKLKRHDWLTMNRHAQRGSHPIPRPKQFYFVAPKNVIPIDKLPAHCGLIEMTPTDHEYFRPVFTKVAPRLKCPTQLTAAQIWNIMVKLSCRVKYQPDPTPEGQPIEKLS